MASTRNYLGSYRLVRLVRGGQTCNVWEAVKHGETEKVALKVLLEEHKHKRQELEQMKNEAKVGQSLDHPYVIKIFGYVDKHDLPFLEMQLFNARNLKQELRDNPQYIALNARQIIDQCAQGLEHVHERGWVHCDIKPDNYLVNEQGNVKLIDFSIAQPMKAKSGGLSSLFAKTKVQGTRSYMSPEQIRGKTLTATSDVYGFGCVLYEIFAHKPPFSGSNPDELLNKHLRLQPPSVQAANRNVSDGFANLVARTLAKDPAKRPQNMTEFLKEFKTLSVYKAGMQPKSAE